MARQTIDLSHIDLNEVEDREIPVVDSGTAGYLEKDKKRIYLCGWEILDDNTLLIYSSNDEVFAVDKKREKAQNNPIFIASGVEWAITEGTKVALDDKKLTVPVNIMCKIFRPQPTKIPEFCVETPKLCIKIDDISALSKAGGEVVE